MTGQIILHHYDTSPFSEKVRLMLGLKGLPWRSVIQPVIMPKPDLVPLTGGYRRIPVMQLGADVYCDTQAILAQIEAMSPLPSVVAGADWAVNLWADRLFFQTTVAVVFGEIGEHVPAAFVADREKLSGRPFDMAAMKAAAPPMRAQWRAHAGWIERGLVDRDFLGGARASLSDVAAYMNVWWLCAAAPSAGAALLDGFPKVQAWRDRLKAVGHGLRTDMTPAEALDAARAARPLPPPAHDPNDPAGIAPGEAVAVSADDYGRDPIAGTLLAASAETIVISREDPSLGRLHVHFPRAGYMLARA